MKTFNIQFTDLISKYYGGVRTEVKPVKTFKSTESIYKPNANDKTEVNNSI